MVGLDKIVAVGVAVQITRLANDPPVHHLSYAGTTFSLLDQLLLLSWTFYNCFVPLVLCTFQVCCLSFIGYLDDEF